MEKVIVKSLEKESDHSFIQTEQEISANRDVLSNIRKKLGIISLRSDADLVRLVEEQLPLGVISALVKHGLQEKEIYNLVLPRRTLQHRRARKEKLTREESDRAVRLARLVALTERVFGDAKAGMDWLRAPKMRDGGRAPIKLMATETGARLVEEMLHQIDQGLAA
jgi:putative toxin-antitoxin system antitoxin component (TIGR02293 family)